LIDIKEIIIGLIQIPLYVINDIKVTFYKIYLIIIHNLATINFVNFN
jgi:hypothetical protein